MPIEQDFRDALGVVDMTAYKTALRRYYIGQILTGMVAHPGLMGALQQKYLGDMAKTCAEAYLIAKSLADVCVSGEFMKELKEK